MLYRNVLKGIADRLIAVIALLLLSPVFLLLTLLLAIANSGKPFFFQARPGKGERIFRVIKFRTMNERRDAAGALLPDSERLTPVGRWVRRTSLDEIPQLINVLKGDMSLVGPRPLLIKYLPYYSGKERLRFSVKPGITGWAQVNGRNLADWNTRLGNDAYYAEHLSLKLDLLVVRKTIVHIFSSKDIAVDPRGIMLDLDEERKNTLHVAEKDHVA